jgi:hypothetical protein
MCVILEKLRAGFFADSNPILRGKYMNALKQYVEYGMSLITVQPGTKIAAISWKEGQNQAADVKQLTEWHQANPDCNWAAITGAISGTVVVDIDSDDAMADLIKRGLPEGPIVSTPRGKHLYFKYPECPVYSRVGILPNVDIRAEGGYVIVPPSQLDDGGSYEWEVGLDEATLPDLPSWLMDLLSADETPVAANQDIPSDPTAHAAAAFAGELNSVLSAREGTRNDTLNNSAYSLGQIVSSGGLGLSEVSTALQTVARHIGLEEDEVRKTVRSGIESGIANPRYKNETPYKLLSYKDLLELPEPTWLIDGLLPSHGISELYGDPAVGKSFVAIDWAAHVATGRDWLGHPVKQGPVVYIYAEGVNGIKIRMSAWSNVHQDLHEAPMKVIGEAVPITEPKAIKDLTSTIRAEFGDDISLVVVDTLARCIGGSDENSTKEMGQFIYALGSLQAEFGCAVLVVHHTGKNADKGARGSSALRAAVDAEFKLSSSGNKVMKLSNHKQKDAEESATIHLKLTPECGSSSCVVEAVDASEWRANDNRNSEPTAEMKKRKILNLLASSSIPLTRKDWIQMIMDADILRSSQASTYIKELVEQGLVVKQDKAFAFPEGADVVDGVYLGSVESGGFLRQHTGWFFGRH